MLALATVFLQMCGPEIALLAVPTHVRVVCGAVLLDEVEAQLLHGLVRFITELTGELSHLPLVFLVSSR